jgi:hypothetical protein
VMSGTHIRSICDSLIRPADWDSNEFYLNPNGPAMISLLK